MGNKDKPKDARTSFGLGAGPFFRRVNPMEI
jgi:hypothetical protein